MANLVIYRIAYQEKKAALKKKLRIIRTMYTSQTAAVFSNRGGDDIFFEDEEDDALPGYFSFAYDMGDNMHTKNLMILKNELGMSVDEIIKLFPQAEEFSGGLYLYWNDISKAREDMDKLYDYIIRRRLV